MSRTLPVAVAAVALFLTACAAEAPSRPVDAATVPAPDPSPDPPGASGGNPSPELVDDPGASSPEAAGPAVEVTLTIPVGELPDGTAGAVTIRTVEAGGRREVVVDTPAGVVDRHVMTEHEHWWWITPLARDVADVEWIHIDLRELDDAGGELPGPVADARVPLPEPGELATGVVLADREVRAVTPVDPDEDRVEVEGLDEPVVLRRRRLPPGTTIELPRGATPLRELPEAFGR